MIWVIYLAIFFILLTTWVLMVRYFHNFNKQQQSWITKEKAQIDKNIGVSKVDKNGNKVNNQFSHELSNYR